MNPVSHDVYVPARPPAKPPPDAGGGETWPRPVFTPGAGGRDRALADRVREALQRGPGRPGPEGAARDLAGLFRAPEAARAVVDRLAREARDLGCSVVVAPGPRGGIVGAPVALAAGLPLVLLGGFSGTDDEPVGRSPGEGGEGAAPLDDSLGADDRVLLVDGVADTGTRLAEASEGIGATGAEVAAVAVAVEVDGGDARNRLEAHDMLSIIRL